MGPHTPCCTRIARRPAGRRIWDQEPALHPRPRLSAELPAPRRGPGCTIAGAQVLRGGRLCKGAQVPGDLAVPVPPIVLGCAGTNGGPRQAWLRGCPRAVGAPPWSLSHSSHGRPQAQRNARTRLLWKLMHQLSLGLLGGPTPFKPKAA